MSKLFSIRKTAVFGAAALAGVLAASGFSAAAGHKHRSGHFVERVSEKLSLTAEQEKRLAEIAEAGAEKRKTLRKNAEEQIRSAVRQESLSKEDALRLFEIRSEKRGEMKQFAAEQFAAFHATLDDGQREKLAEIAPRFLKMLGGERRGKRGNKKHRRHRWH